MMGAKYQKWPPFFNNLLMSTRSNMSSIHLQRSQNVNLQEENMFDVSNSRRKIISLQDLDCEVQPFAKEKVNE